MHIRQNYRTKPCLNFTIKGCCPYGSRCHYLHEPIIHVEEKEDGGQTTRSNSEESVSSRSSRCDKTHSFWSRMSHNKRIELIQNLGFDYQIRYYVTDFRSSSRLMQLLRSNESEESWEDAWMFEERPIDIVEPVGKKYSL